MLWYTVVYIAVVPLKVKVAQSCPTLCDPMDCPWNSLGQNTGVDSLSLLQGIFPTQESNRGLLHCRRILCQLSCQGSPVVLLLRNTWSNRQIWPWNTEWSKAKTNRVLPWECTGHSKHPLPTTQEKTLHMDITRWSTPKSDWLYSLQPKMEKLYTVSKNKTGSWLWLRSWTQYCQIQT